MGLKEVWKDPVWSKVIASTILLGAGFLVSIMVPDLNKTLEKWMKYEIVVPIWILAIIGIICFLVLLVLKRRQPLGEAAYLSSKQWFSEIDRQIKDCNFARIYLREFSHPDQFRPEHRESLLSFMRSLAKRLEAGADIEIVAYHYSQSEKSGLDWLRSEIKNNLNSLKRIKLILNQPVSNSSSMYLFDSGIVLYNRRDNENHSYHVENFHGSIVHYLIVRGFQASKGELL